MKPELAFKLANGIELLHTDGNHHYTNQTLADTIGVSTSTIKRNREIIKILDIAMYLRESEDE